MINNEKTRHESFFNREGYILLCDYVDDILYMKKNGPWKLPLSLYDLFFLYFAKCICWFSFFKKNIFIYNTFFVSPAYASLVIFLQKKNIISGVYQKDTHNGDYFSYTISAAKNEHKKEIYGNGVGRSKDLAFSRALGEVIERQVSAFSNKNKTICIDSIENIKKKFPNNTLNPYDFHDFCEAQLTDNPHLKIKESALIPWVIGQNLVTEEDVFLPKQITSWLFGVEKEQGIFFQTSSNGTAFAFSQDEAIVSAILETVQRDAFLVHWLTQTPPKKIRESTLPLWVKQEIDAYKKKGIHVHVLDITSDILIPSICIMAFTENKEMSGVVVSAATSFSTDEAIRDALREMVLCARTLYKAPSEVSSDIKPFISDLNKETRVQYARGSRASLYKWFVLGEEVTYKNITCLSLKEGDPPKEKKEYCLQLLKKFGPDYYPIMYTFENSVVASLGGTVTKIVIPRLFPFYLTEKYGTFKSKRLEDFCSYKHKTSFIINELPHVFT